MQEGSEFWWDIQNWWWTLTHTQGSKDENLNIHKACLFLSGSVACYAPNSSSEGRKPWVWFFFFACSRKIKKKSRATWRTASKLVLFFLDPWLIKLQIVVEVKGGSHECDSLLLMFSVGNTLCYLCFLGWSAIFLSLSLFLLYFLTFLVYVVYVVCTVNFLPLLMLLSSHCFFPFSNVAREHHISLIYLFIYIIIIYYHF